MTEESKSNVDRLEQEGGFEIKRPLPKEYEDVINNLDDAHIDSMIEAKRRLDEAELQTAPEVGPHREYVVPF